MSSQAPSSPSPYAAPNSPIASAKRPRIQRKELKSPSIKMNSNDYGNKNQISRRTIRHTSSSSSLAVPATPSKIMFSPVLRDTNVTSSNEYKECSEKDDPRILQEIENEKIDKEREKQAQRAQVQKEEDEETDDEDIFNPYLFMALLPSHAQVKIKNKLVIPPMNPAIKNPPMTLVLDLDETLVHCTVEPVPNADIVFPVTFNGTIYQVYVRKRPYLDYFLETVSKLYEIIIFTASQKVYADVLLDQLDPERRIFKEKSRMFREACLLVQGNYIKDLSVISRDPRRMVLVDNSPHAYSYDIDNGVPIESWYDDPTDTELLKLIGFLRKLSEPADVRPVIREHFKTYQLIENARNGLPFHNEVPPF